MVHHGLDGRVFRVRRPVCGERAVVAKRQDNAGAFVPPALLQDGTVEANF